MQRLAEFEAGPEPTGKDARSLTRRARQIEKDERFWVAAALMGVFHSRDRVGNLAALLTDALGPTLPVEGLTTWKDALAGELHLFFEVSLPSPPVYRRWLHDHIGDRALIPYVREAAAGAGERLEGPTHVDALLLSETTGFAVLFEAKVISDADAKVSFDVMRNQLARNIDVMLDVNPRLKPPLAARQPERTCFVLLTPEVFKRYPHSRLYGWLLPSYQADSAALARDLPHRDQPSAEDPIDWPALTRRLGWLTFEDCERITPGVQLADATSSAPDLSDRACRAQPHSMWIFTISGFYSIIADRQRPGHALVRARVREDIDAFCARTGAPEAIETPDRDYRFRTSIPYATLAADLAAQAEGIDYSNFKTEVAARQALTVRAATGASGRSCTTCRKRLIERARGMRIFQTR